MFTREELTNENRDNQLAALKRELAGYVSNGDEERADQVRSEIAALDGDDEKPARPARKQAGARLRGGDKKTR